MTTRVLLFVLACASCLGPTNAPLPPSVRATQAQGRGGGGKDQLCPSSVPGAVTRVRDVPGGVEVDVEGADERAREDIWKRALFLADASAHDPDLQRGKDKGFFGECPVVMAGTRVVAGRTDRGARILVWARDDSQVSELRRQAHERSQRVAGSTRPRL